MEDLSPGEPMSEPVKVHQMEKVTMRRIFKTCVFEKVQEATQHFGKKAKLSLG